MSVAFFVSLFAWRGSAKDERVSVVDDVSVRFGSVFFFSATVYTPNVGLGVAMCRN